MTTDMVFVQTNEADNAVIAFHRDGDGALTEFGRFPTGGAGDAQLHLTSQGSVTLSRDGRHLLVTNAASDDLTLFAIGGDGVHPVGRTAAGSGPKSVTERDGLVFVLATAKPGLTALRITGDGLEAVPGGEVPLSGPDADPAQVGISPDGSVVVVTERGTDSVVWFPLEADGTAGALRSIPSSGPTPYGFAFTSRGTLVVTEAFRAQTGAAAASSYAVRGGEITAVTRSVGNGRSEICWAVVTPDDRFAFTTNFADGAVSSFAVGEDGTLSLRDATAGISVDGRLGLRDEALAGGGSYLYGLDADAGRIFGWAVGETGDLSPVGSWGDLPPTAAGLAAT